MYKRQIYRLSTSSTSSQVQKPSFTSAWVVWISAGVTVSSTASSRSGSPPTMPRVAATSMPRIPPELGTMTPFTFLMMLPLHRTRQCSGITPSSCRALAPA